MSNTDQPGETAFPHAAAVSQALLWLDRQGSSLHTIRTRRTSWRIYLDWAVDSGVDVLEAEPEHGQAYLAYLRDRYSAPASVMNRLAQTRALYLCWHELKLTLAEPFRGLLPPQNQPAARRRIFSSEEVDRLLWVIGDESRAFLLLGLRLGLTSAAMVNLTWELLDLERSTIILGKASEMIPLDRRTKNALSRLAVQRRGLDAFLTGQVFPDLRHAQDVATKLKTLCRAQGVYPQSWLVLRNTSGLSRNTREVRSLRQKEMTFKSPRSLEYLEQRRHIEDGELVNGPRPGRRERRQPSRQ